MSTEYIDKHVVLISRLWKNPNIAISVVEEGIDISVSLKDFVEAMAHEVGSPTMLMTRAALLDKMKQAAEKVAQDMKAETGRVM